MLDETALLAAGARHSLEAPHPMSVHSGSDSVKQSVRELHEELRP